MGWEFWRKDASRTDAIKYMIQISNLTKKFGSVVVLQGISMTLKPGKIYGFVGRNGSGKTMLMRHMLGFVHPTEGTIAYDGKELGKDIEMPENVGAIIENPGFLSEYTGFRNLQLLGRIRGKVTDEEIRESIRTVGLDPNSRKRVGTYSLGMRQRLGIAQALMENPDILLLDEPLSGLDNDGVEEIRKVFLAQREKGKTVVLASHSNEDIAILCDEVFRFDKGRIIEHIVREDSAGRHQL